MNPVCSESRASLPTCARFCRSCHTIRTLDSLLTCTSIASGKRSAPWRRRSAASMLWCSRRGSASTRRRSAERVCENLNFLGLELDRSANETCQAGCGCGHAGFGGAYPRHRHTRGFGDHARDTAVAGIVDRRAAGNRKRAACLDKQNKIITEPAAKRALLAKGE